jgi:uncharacterized protein YkwD
MRILVRASVSAVAVLLLLFSFSVALAAAGRPDRLRAHAASAHCYGAHMRVSQAPRAVVKAAVVCLINRERTSYGLAPLRESARLDLSAQKWTDAMVASRTLTHGSDFAERISAVGYHWHVAGENIASGFRTAAGVVNAWIHSPGHCENIMSPQYTSVGTGVVDRGVAGIGAATWTQDFAAPMGVSASGNWGPADSIC